MSWWIRRGKRVTVALTALLAAACGRVPDGDKADAQEGAASGRVENVVAAIPTNAPIENIRIPVERWPDGTIKTQIHAASAQMPEEGGDVLADRLRIEMFTPSGALENLVLAKDCRYNRQNGQAFSEGSVHFEREGVLITGRGFQWNGTDEVVKITSNVRVVLQHNMRWEAAAGLAGKAKQE